MKGIVRSKRIVCEDGFTVSVQASALHYCEPRNDEGPYSAVELGFPSEEEPLIVEFADEEDNLTETVYGWVPSHVVKKLMAKHGGIMEGQLPHLV
jgi:hypothetical protein